MHFKVFLKEYKLKENKISHSKTTGQICGKSYPFSENLKSDFHTQE